MRILIIIGLLFLASLSSAKAFDQGKCIEGCGSKQECIDKCTPEDPIIEEPPVQNNTTVAQKNESAIQVEEDAGICGPAVILIGFAVFLIRNAEREI